MGIAMCSTSQASSEEAEVLSNPDFGDLAGEVRKWSHACGVFLEWERRHLLSRQATEKDCRDHKFALKWFIRFTRMMLSTVADPEFPNRSLAEDLEGRLWQLEQSWKMIYEAMPETEADKLLSEVFPNAC